MWLPYNNSSWFTAPSPAHDLLRIRPHPVKGRTVIVTYRSGTGEDCKRSAAVICKSPLLWDKVGTDLAWWSKLVGLHAKA